MLNQAMMLNGTPMVSYKSRGLFRICGLNPSTSITQDSGAGSSDPLLAISQHAICLSQVNIQSYEHSSHTDTPLQNPLPTMPFSKHLCL